MNILAIILLIAVIGTLNIVCFFIGAKVGQQVAKDEPVKLPNMNPVEIIREHQQTKEAERAEKEQSDYLGTILSNIDNYNGTEYGQKDVPGKVGE